MDEPWLERNDHPLLNHLVLTTTFRYVQGLDLSSCRLMCKAWNFSTLPFARSRLHVTILGSKSENVPELRSYENFVKLMRTNTLGIPFGKFRLGPFDASNGIGQEFVGLCANTVIEYSFVDNCDYKVEDISAILSASPKLESFKMPMHMSSKEDQDKIVKLFRNTNLKFPSLTSLDFGQESSLTRRRICPTLYEEFFGAAENISTFDLMGLTATNNSGYVGAEILKIIEKFGREKSIKSLKLPNVNHDIFEVLGRMVSKGLALKHLAFMFKSYDHDILVRFLQLFTENLISLHIITFYSSTMPVTFPIMQNLKILKAEIYGESRLFCEIFSNAFPVLQKFIYGGENWNLFHNFLTGQQGSSSTISLNLGSHPKINIQVFSQILTVFPVLKELDCAITDEDGVKVIRKIWTHMTQLQVLKISCTLPAMENVDALLTGIPIEEIIKIQLTDFCHTFGQMEMEARTEEILTQINKHRKLPSIGNLTDLRYLHLSLTSQKCETQMYNSITDLTGYFGLYSLEHLRHLSLSDCLISRSCAEILVKDKGLLNWMFSDSAKFLTWTNNPSEMEPGRRFSYNNLSPRHTNE